MKHPSLTNKIKKEFPRIILKKGTKYALIESFGPIDLYLPCSDNEAIDKHIEHIASDFEEDGYKLITAKGHIDDKKVISILLFEVNE